MRWHARRRGRGCVAMASEEEARSDQRQAGAWPMVIV